MKQRLTFYLLLFGAVVTSTSTIACGSESASQHGTSVEDGVAIESSSGTSQKAHVQDSQSLSCTPVLSFIKMHDENVHVFQVTDFDPSDEQCWIALERHGHRICRNMFPCRIYYTESDDLGRDPKDSFYPDFKTLEKYGVADYVKLRSGWQISGAGVYWEREGYNYVNHQKD